MNAEDAKYWESLRNKDSHELITMLVDKLNEDRKTEMPLRQRKQADLIRQELLNRSQKKCPKRSDRRCAYYFPTPMGPTDVGEARCKYCNEPPPENL